MLATSPASPSSASAPHRGRVKRWLKHIALFACGVIVLLLIIGFSYEAIEPHMDAPSFLSALTGPRFLASEVSHGG